MISHCSSISGSQQLYRRHKRRPKNLVAAADTCCRSLAVFHLNLDANVQDVAYLYAAYAHDRKNGTSEATTFSDALKQHHLIDQMRVLVRKGADKNGSLTFDFYNCSL